jgi:uncharacterized protein
MGDDTYNHQPKFMSLDTIRNLAIRINSHCLEKNVGEAFITFHGGEPLLASKDFYQSAIDVFRSIIDKSIKTSFTVQTNGTLLKPDWVALFGMLKIQIGVSIDGTKSSNDKNRYYHNYQGTFDDILKGISHVKADELGLISVVNTNESPAEIYELYKETKATVVTLLFPDIHHDHIKKDSQKSDYGAWVIELYKIWRKDKAKSRPRISLFEIIISILIGNKSGDEILGTVELGSVVIETNGGIEVTDPLRIVSNGFTKNILNVDKDEISEITKLPIYKNYYFSHQDEVLCQKCRDCPISGICGGGYFAHRYSSLNGFDNPSVYCNDLVKIITHIQNDFIESLPQTLLNDLGLEKISYEEVVETWSKSINKHLTWY